MVQTLAWMIFTIPHCFHREVSTLEALRQVLRASQKGYRNSGDLRTEWLKAKAKYWNLQNRLLQQQPYDLELIMDEVGHTLRKQALNCRTVRWFVP